MDAKRLTGVLLIGSWSVAAVVLYCCTSLSGLDDKVFDLGGGGAGATTANGGSGATTGGSGGTAGAGGSLYRLAEPVWAVQFGGDGIEHAAAVAVGPSDEIVIAGFFQGYLPLPDDCSLGTAAGPTKIFVAQLTGPDECAWSTSFGVLESELELDVAVDPSSGHVFVVGGLEGDLLDGEVGGAAPFTTNSYDAFYVEYDTDGGYVDHHFYRGDGTQRLSGIALSASGDKFVVGHHEGSFGLGGGCPIQTACAACEDDVIVAQIDEDGICRFVHHVASGDEQHGNAVAVGEDGIVVFTGLVRGNIDFAGASFPGASDPDIYVASVELDGGEERWLHRWGDEVPQSGESVAVDPDTGDVFVTGLLAGRADFGWGGQGHGSDDAFLVRLNRDGGVQYGRAFGTPLQSQSGATVLARSDGAALLGGTFGGTLECIEHEISAVDTSMFLARFAPDGAPAHCQSFHSSSIFEFADMAARGPRSIVLFGHFVGDLRFGSDTLTADELVDDLFLAEVELLPGL